MLLEVALALATGAAALWRPDAAYPIHSRVDPYLIQDIRQGAPLPGTPVESKEVKIHGVSVLAIRNPR